MESSRLYSLRLGVYLPGAVQPTPAALLKVERQGVSEHGTLSYGLQYQSNHDFRFHPDPALALPVNHLPSKRLRDGGALPPYLKDSLPDAWGRLVLAAANQGAALDDYAMLSCTNQNRIGALVVMDQDPQPQPEAVPLSLTALYEMAMAIQYGLDVPLDIRRLLTQGGSLGGARPKASISDKGALWLAKFPLREDPFNIELAEAGTMALAQQCHIQTADFRCVDINQCKVFLIKRFDREAAPEGEQRIHFLSAAGLLNMAYESGLGSYVELAQALTRFGINPKQDCQELFRRMVFNILIDNTDDHIKNHGFLYVADNKYRLAPVYDVHPQGTHLQYMGMPLVNDNASPSLDQLLAEAHHFHYSVNEARSVVHELITTVSRQWRAKLMDAGVSDADIRYLAANLDPIHARWQVMDYSHDLSAGG